MSLVLGLDVGVSSVGWAILDKEKEEIVDAGVRLFNEVNRNANQDRRNLRSARRVNRRRKHRIIRTKLFLKTSGFPITNYQTLNPYESRRKAIYEKASKEEIVAAILHIAKRRGTVLDSPEENEVVANNELSTKKQLLENDKLLKNKYICEIQLERLQNKHEKIRNHKNRFKTTDYVREVKAILINQQQYYSEIDEFFINNIIELIEKRRQYFEGPGSKKSPTLYGRYFITNGKLQEMSMIEKMRGKCTYLSDEPRVAKMAYTAELFDLLNGDLAKIKIENKYLSKEEKEVLVNNLILKGKNITLKEIMKLKGCNDESLVSGYRINFKNGSPTFTEFKGYKEIKKIVESNQLPYEILTNAAYLDGIADILTAEKSYERRENELKKLFVYYSSDIDLLNRIIDAFKESTNFKGYHSLSKKIMVEIMGELWETNKNQMEVLVEIGYEQKKYAAIINGNKIKFDDSAVLSSVANRAHRETIKIINAIRKKYGELDSIVIETAKEKNSEEERKAYQDLQKEVGKFEKEVCSLLNIKSLKELQLTPKQYLALKLLKSQDYKCIYSGKSITPQQIVNNFSLFEIDHILPLSISFDDSQQNKVVCYFGDNQKKKQRTPYQYLINGEGSRSFDVFKLEVTRLYSSKLISGKKKDYLLEQRDIKNNLELQKEFINRNLVDTRYATRSLGMNLRSFFQAKGIETKVFCIRGSFTSAVRKKARIKKDRNKSYEHHAVDAILVAAISRMELLDGFKKYEILEDLRIVSKETGEIVPENEFYDEKFIKLIRSLTQFKPKYSHKVDRKLNRQMTNQTIYSTRLLNEEEYILGKSGNIYSLDKKQVESLVKKIRQEPDHFLMKKYNPSTFELIEKIIEEYKSEVNPFAAYKNDHGYILKDGKVPVKFLRYYDSRLFIHKSITHKYPNSNNKVALLSIKGVRIDVYRNIEGTYKYLGVPYHWFKKQGNQYVLNMDLYIKEKAALYKRIDDTFEFQFSLYKNDLFSYEKNNVLEYRIFRGDSMPRTNKIETDFIFKKKKEQKEGYLAIGTLKKMIKYNVDILGPVYKVTKQNFETTLQS